MVRNGPIVDSRLMAWKLAASRRVLVASPAYLERHGVPGSVEELDGHRGLFYTNRGVADWRFPLPDGTVMTRADLPPPETRRWVASRKVAVVNAVQAGLISRGTALEMYGLSEEELDEWIGAVTTHGVGALRATWLQRYRQP